MAGAIIPATPAATVLEEQRHGFNKTSLTNFNSTAEPQIVGNFEIAGSLASFATADSITGWGTLGNGTVYVKVVPDTGAGTVAAQFTDIAPSWDGVKQGWYGTGANANHRYLFRLTKGGASLYQDKRRLNDTGDTAVALYKTNQDTQTTDDVVFNRVQNNIPPFESGGLTQKGQVFTALQAAIPSVGDYCVLPGTYLNGSGGGAESILTFSARRDTATNIVIRGINYDTGAGVAENFTSGDVTVYSGFFLYPGIVLG